MTAGKISRIGSILWLLSSLVLLLLLGSNARAQLPHDLIGVASYFSQKDGFQHAIVASGDSGLHEVYFDPHRGIFSDQLSCFSSIAGIGAYFTPNDGIQHAIVGTNDGQIHELFFNPSIGIHLSRPALATFNGIVGVAAYYTPNDQIQHVIVATKDGQIHEVFFSPSIGSHVSQPALATFNGIVGVAAYYTPNDQIQHVIVATNDGQIHEVFFSPSIGSHVSQPALATFNGIVGVAGYYTPSDQIQHVIVATNDGQIHEVFFSPSIGAHITQPALSTIPDVGITRVELNQAIQDLNNTIPLFKTKRTLVRVYPNVGCSMAGPQVTDLTISAAVYAPNDFSKAVWGPVTIGPATIPRQINREQLDQTINFELPPSIDWSTSQPYTLRVISNPCIDLTADPGNCSRRSQLIGKIQDTPLRFYEAVPLHVQAVYAQDASGTTVPQSTLNQVTRRWNALYPAQVVVHDTALVVPSGTFSWSYVTALLAMWQAQAAGLPPNQEPPNCSSCRVMGVLTGCTPDWCGLAPLCGVGAAVAMFSNDINFSTAIAAQEIGHDLCRQHASSAHGEPSPDPNFAYAHGEISDNQSSLVVPNLTSRGRYYGADPGTNPVNGNEWRIIPAYTPDNSSHHHDFMSYGGGPDEWVSDYTYKGLCAANLQGKFDSWYSKASGFPSDELPPANLCATPMTASASAAGTPMASAATQRLIDSLLVRGTINTKGVGTLVPGYRVQLPADSPFFSTGQGSYRIQLRDRSGGVLSEKQFAPPSHELGKTLDFSEAVPWKENTVDIVLRNNERIIGRLVRPGRAAGVEFIESPHGLFEKPQLVSWKINGTQPIGPFVGALLFSPNGRNDWRTVALDVHGSSFIVDPSVLPGGHNGQLRLIISDGFSSVTADGQRDLEVRSKPPKISVTEPENGMWVAPGERLTLRGQAISPQSGLLDGEALRWYLGSRLLGSGRLLEPRGLPAGEQELRMEAKDRDGNTSSVTIRVNLQPGSVPVLGDAAGTVIPSIHTGGNPH